MKLMISTPVLKELALAGAAHDLRATEQDGGFVLTIQVGSEEKFLGAQRGGVRVFKTLDSMARYIESVGLKQFEVLLTGQTKSSKTYDMNHATIRDEKLT